MRLGLLSVYRVLISSIPEQDPFSLVGRIITVNETVQK